MMNTARNIARLGSLILVICACTGETGSTVTTVPTPPSLQGTVPDGALPVDAQGQFVANAEAIRFFDYYLAAEGEVTDQELHGLVYAAVRNRLPQAPAAEAMEAFERYLAYRTEAAEILTDASQNVDSALDRLHRLHAETVSGMPGLADGPQAFDRAAALYRVLSDRNLDRDTRTAQVAAIQASMAPRQAAEQQAHHDSNVLLRLRAAERRLHDQGASEQEIHDLRVDMVGAEAAARLAALAQQRQAWQERLDAYDADRTALVQQFSEIMPQAERKAALNQLRRAHFAASEQARVRAVERSKLQRATP